MKTHLSLGLACWEGPFELQVDWIRTYGSALIDADVRASNGVIHVSDAVLLPRETK